MNIPEKYESSAIAPVWSGHYVAFMLKTRGDSQFVAFFDRERYMTIAKRRLDSHEWQVVRVPPDQPSPFGAKAKPTRVGWDSHNYIAFDFDADGQIHLSGNLHCEPLLYFRTRTPGDISTFERIDYMTGEREERVTYPTFIRAADGAMIFRYRDGKSGNGDEVFNRYDPATKKWSRLIASAFTDGRGKMNAYPVGPRLGPDGYFHLVWIWRNTPDCATNHDISYARTKDLQHWETSDGRRLSLPITLESAEIVDPVPVGGGAVNNNTLIGFDSKGKVVITFHKYDANGNTQIYNARREVDGWRSVPATSWNHRWEFSGLGTIIGEVGLEPVRPLADGRLVQSWWNAWSGRGGCVLDEKTLEPIGDYVAPPRYPQSLEVLESGYPEMQSRWCADSGDRVPGVRYAMRWETLPANRDRARPEPWPEPSMLRAFKFAAP